MNSEGVVEIVVEWLEAVKPVSVEVLQLAQQLLGDDSPETVLEALADTQAPEHEMFKELLLFPDSALEVQVAKQLEWRAMEGLLSVAGQVVTAAQSIRRHYGETSLECLVSAQDVELVLKRLKVDVSFPESMWKVLAGLPEPLRYQVAMRLRRGRFEWDSVAEHFLSALCMRMGSEPDFAQLVDYSVLLLEAEGTEESLVDVLKRRRQQAKRNLKDYEVAMERMQKGNYETMIMQGQLPPHADPHLLKSEMEYTDRICLAVFGVSASSRVVESDLGQVEGASGVEQMLRLGGEG